MSLYLYVIQIGKIPVRCNNAKNVKIPHSNYDNIIYHKIYVVNIFFSQIYIICINSHMRRRVSE